MDAAFGAHAAGCFDSWILRARKANENGEAALLEFITSAETAFSHRRGAA